MKRRVKKKRTSRANKAFKAYVKALSSPLPMHVRKALYKKLLKADALSGITVEQIIADARSRSSK